MRKNQSGIAHLAIVLIILVVAAVAGAGLYVYNNNKNNNQLNSEVADTSTDLTDQLPSDLLSIDQIKELATTSEPALTVTGIELESEDGVYIYKVRLSNGTVLAFDAKSGTAVAGSNESELESDEDIPATSAAISFDKARELALAQKPGGTIVKIEFELDGGKLIYKVRFSDEARIDIDATSGAVVKTEPGKTTEDDSDEDSDDDEDEVDDNPEDSIDD